MVRKLINIKRFINDVRGLTLIDLAMAMIVLGLIATPWIQSYNQEQKYLTYGTTLTNIQAIQNAMKDFYFEKKRYPCPASLTANESDPTYGEELSPCSLALGAVSPAPASDETAVGGVPFKTLKIPFKTTLDGWSRKITYVVTMKQTSVATYTPGGGKLTMFQIPSLGGGKCADRSLASNSTMPGNGHALLISHGDDGVGGYNADGILTAACPTGAGTPLDAQNCDYMTDTSLTFFDEQCARSLKAGTDHYDDIVSGWASTPARIWRYSDDDPLSNPTTDPNKDIYTDLKIGINTTTPAVEVHVMGNIKAQEDTSIPPDPTKKGYTDSNYICKTNGGDCMMPQQIGGAGMGCSDGNAGVGINNNAINCQPEILDVDGCVSGEWLIGLNAANDPVCIPQ